MTDQPTVFILDDDETSLETLREQVEELMIPVETFRTPAAFFAAYDPGRRGCLIVDQNMPEMTGLQVLEGHLRREHTVPVIMVTGFADIPTSVAALKAGAADLLEKPVSSEALAAAIARAFELDRNHRDRNHRQRVRRARLERLTPRERDVLRLVIAGHQTKSVAAVLKISPRTVEIHRAHIMHKLEVQTLPQLMQLGLGMMPLPTGCPPAAPRASKPAASSATLPAAPDRDDHPCPESPAT